MEIKMAKILMAINESCVTSAEFYFRRLAKGKLKKSLVKMQVHKRNKNAYSEKVSTNCGLIDESLIHSCLSRKED